MKEIFCQRPLTYNLRSNKEFLQPKVRTTSYGSETIKYGEGIIFGYLYLNILGMLNVSMSLRKKLKVGMALTAHVDYVGRLYLNSAFYSFY